MLGDVERDRARAAVEVVDAVLGLEVREFCGDSVEGLGLLRIRLEERVRRDLERVVADPVVDDAGAEDGDDLFAESRLRDAGVELGRSYPAPMVGLKESRARALAAFHSLSDSG